jgi:1,2-diacylglycerol 3-beta-galactosyltransferase
VLSDDDQVPIWVVVTDIATRNVFWFDKRAEMTIVPTVKAMNVAAQNGIVFDQLRLLGVPVSKSYKADPNAKSAICVELNMDSSNPVVIVAGGKEGVGPLDAVSQRIDERFEGINLLVLTGRNENLRQRLSGYNWKNSTHVFGYVNDIWRLMWAADVMVTKAGTGMLAEALSAQLPMILFHRVPYLEDSNVSFLVENGAALWAPTPKMVLNALSRWLVDPDALQTAQQSCRRLAKPNSAEELGKLIIMKAEQNHQQGNG